MNDRLLRFLSVSLILLVVFLAILGIRLLFLSGFVMGFIRVSVILVTRFCIWFFTGGFLTVPETAEGAFMLAVVLLGAAGVILFYSRAEIPSRLRVRRTRGRTLVSASQARRIAHSRILGERGSRSAFPPHRDRRP